MRTFLISAIFLLIPAMAMSDENSDANKLLVEAVKLQNEANESEDPATRRRLLKEALTSLNALIDRYPSSDVAVKLITNQNVGTLNIAELKSQVQTLDLPSCLDEPTFDCLTAQAEKSAGELSDVEEKTQALSGIIMTKLAAGEREGLQSNFDALIPVLRQLPHNRRNANSRKIAQIALQVAEFGEFDAAITLMKLTTNRSEGMTDGARDQNLEKLVKILVSADELELAESILPLFTASDRGHKAGAMVTIGIGYAEKGNRKLGEAWVREAYGQQVARESGLYSSFIATDRINSKAFGSNIDLEKDLPDGSRSKIGALGAAVVAFREQESPIAHLALDELEKTIRAAPPGELQDYGAALQISEAYAAVGEFEKAEDFIRATVDKRSQDYPLENLGAKALSSGNIYKAIEIEQRLISDGRQPTTLSHDLAVAFARSGNVDLALKRAESIQSEAWRGDAFHGVMKVALNRGNLVKFLRESAEIESDQWKDFINKEFAEFYWDEGNPEKAMFHYDKVKAPWRRDSIIQYISQDIIRNGGDLESDILEAPALQSVSGKIRSQIRSHLISRGHLDIVMSMIEDVSDPLDRSGLLMQAAFMTKVGLNIEAAYPLRDGVVSASAEGSMGAQHQGWRAEATDFDAPQGADVLAVTSGTVVFVQNDAVDGEEASASEKCGEAFEMGDQSIGRGCMGNFVTIEHNPFGQVFYASYMNLGQDSITVTVGERVEQGEIIGQIGNTGLRSEPHLHFQAGTRLLDASQLKDPFFAAKIADASAREERLITWKGDNRSASSE